MNHHSFVSNVISGLSIVHFITRYYHFKMTVNQYRIAYSGVLRKSGLFLNRGWCATRNIDTIFRRYYQMMNKKYNIAWICSINLIQSKIVVRLPIE